MKKFISLILTGSLIIAFVSLPLQSVSAQVKGNQFNTVMTDSNYTTNMSASTQKIADSYVKLKENKYVIENEEELVSKIGNEQLEEVKKQIAFTNEQLAQVDLTYAEVTGNTVEVKLASKETNDGIMLYASKEGIDKMEFHWTYATVWISKTTAEKTIKVGSGALGTAIGGIGGKIASAIAGSIIGGTISEFFADSIAKAVKFNIALVPPFHTWNIQEQ